MWGLSLSLRWKQAGFCSSSNFAAFQWIVWHQQALQERDCSGTERSPGKGTCVPAWSRAELGQRNCCYNYSILIGQWDKIGWSEHTKTDIGQEGREFQTLFGLFSDPRERSHQRAGSTQPGQP